MVPDFEIFTSRLHLRILKAEDTNTFATTVTYSASLHQWLDWCHPGFNFSDAKEFIMANRLNWAKSLAYGFGVFDRKSNQFLGMVAITEFSRISNMASVGYWIADKYQCNGYAKEAMLAIIEFSFAELKLTRLEIICDPENKPSHELAKKCGAVQEGIARNRFIFNGKPQDGLVFSIVP